MTADCWRSLRHRAGYGAVLHGAGRLLHEQRHENLPRGEADGHAVPEILSDAEGAAAVNHDTTSNRTRDYERYDLQASVRRHEAPYRMIHVHG